MKTLNLTILSLLALFASPLHAAEPAPAPAAPAATGATAPAPALVWVTSPWGFTDLYAVHHGTNFLICSGTGLRFRFYWSGC